ncbi:uncharacterized protein KY384_000721 [Bacidia gigantensis]|uniref:uncharacterized protein n=1 Tax=Bacidia gigantensis TaxID=2732470 RepID=UPI001D036E4D|nr:uncharacterized protein KY384_000721 [Bacidia gigantensis]KAG8525959.1 hypothetical protein KY384_000721 [Bacidia gigantensis]
MSSSNTLDPVSIAIQQYQNALLPQQKKDFLTSKVAAPLSADAVLAFTAEVDALKSRRTSRCVASRLQGTLQSVQQFTSIIGTFVTSNPAIAALVWGSLRLTILAACNLSSFFDKLTGWFMKMQDCCPRYREYQHLFPESVRLREALSNFYACLIDFCTKAMEAINKPGISDTFKCVHSYSRCLKLIVLALYTGILHYAKTIFVSFDVEFVHFTDSVQERSKIVKEEIRLAADTCAERERQLQLVERKDAAKHRVSSLVFRRTIAQNSKEEHFWRQQLQVSEHRTRKQRLLDQLSSFDYLAPWKRESKKRYGETANWLCATEEYSHWVTKESTSIFLLSGKLGSGKTILATAVVDDVVRFHLPGSSKIAYFFCRHDQIDSCEPKTILRCLLRQYLSSNDLTRSSEERLSGMLGMSPDFEELQSLFLNICAEFDSRIYLLIDGFDEIERAHRLKILGLLSRLIALKRSKIKVILVGRDEIIQDVRCALQVFLWVYFQIEDICDQATDADIQETLIKLPKDLHSTYERLLAKIIKSPQKIFARRMFAWVACARRPLTLLELREAIAIERHQQWMDPSRLVNDIDQMVPWCRNLLVLDEEQSLVHFTHPTVKEYLLECQKEHVSILGDFRDSESMENIIADACFTYLQYREFGRGLISQQSIQIDPKRLTHTALSTNLHPKLATSLRLLNKVVTLRQLEKGKIALPPPKNSPYKSPFLAYASQFWLMHASELTPKDGDVWQHFQQLFPWGNAVAVLPFSVAQWNRLQPIVRQYVVEHDHQALLSLIVERIYRNWWTQEQNSNNRQPYVPAEDVLAANSQLMPLLRMLLRKGSFRSFSQLAFPITLRTHLFDHHESVWREYTKLALRRRKIDFAFWLLRYGVTWIDGDIFKSITSPFQDTEIQETVFDAMTHGNTAHRHGRLEEIIIMALRDKATDLLAQLVAWENQIPYPKPMRALLERASARGKRDIVEGLLEAGVKYKQSSRVHLTPLQEAYFHPSLPSKLDITEEVAEGNQRKSFRK